MSLPKTISSAWLGLLLLFLSAQNGLASKEHPYQGCENTWAMTALE